MILEVKDVSKSFGGLMAVNKVSFTVNEGEIVGLIGPNGSGKTTLFNLITGFIKPDEGEITFEGTNIAGLKPFQICRMGIARTFQLVRPFAEMTVAENVLAAACYGCGQPSNASQIHMEAKRVLEFIGFESKAGEIAHKISLVERKRLELGRALAAKPKLLLLDEMMAGLNPTEIEDVMRLIERTRNSGITVVVVEHVMKALLRLSDRVIVLSAGQKIAEGTPQEVVASEQVVEAYLGREYNA